MRQGNICSPHKFKELDSKMTCTRKRPRFSSHFALKKQPKYMIQAFDVTTVWCLQLSLPGIEMSITHMPWAIQAFIKEKNLPLMSSLELQADYSKNSSIFLTSIHHFLWIRTCSIVAFDPWGGSKNSSKSNLFFLEGWVGDFFVKILGLTIMFDLFNDVLFIFWQWGVGRDRECFPICNVWIFAFLLFSRADMRRSENRPFAHELAKPGTAATSPWTSRIKNIKQGGVSLKSGVSNGLEHTYSTVVKIFRKSSALLDVDFSQNMLDADLS